MAFSAFGQDTIPNGDFEQWVTTNIYSPAGFPYTSDFQNFSNKQPLNVLRVTDSYGSLLYAAELFTTVNQGDTSLAYMVNNNPQNGSFSTWHGGVPLSQMPTSFRGYYKYASTSDSATIILAFSQGGVNIGTYTRHLGPASTYTLFQFPMPTLAQTPDSVVIAFAASLVAGNNPTGVPGDTLKIDSISFTGLPAQPAGLNGDFLVWNDTAYTYPNVWNLNGGGNSVTGVKQTTDAVHGMYAIELTTILGNQNNHVAARSGQIMLGYYQNNCNGNCSEKGGIPFTNQKDTLCFFYKYLPMNGDSAGLSLQFVLNGNLFNFAGGLLPESDQYTYMEIPFDAGQQPDSVQINIQSSNWDDTLLQYVGSDLKIDRMFFKSQVLPKTNPVITWATPSDITSGTALSSTQLDASVSQLGELLYADTIGQVLKSGTDTLWVTFIPLDQADYNIDTAFVLLNVNVESVLPLAKNSTLTFYPNPAHEQVTVSSKDVISSLSITDINGKVLMVNKQVNQSNVTIPLNGLSKGVYILSVSNGKNIVQEKLIVQ